MRMKTAIRLDIESSEKGDRLGYCLVDSHHGIYAPQMVWEAMQGNVPKKLHKQFRDLESPDNEFYYEAMDEFESWLNDQIPAKYQGRWCFYWHEGDFGLYRMPHCDDCGKFPVDEEGEICQRCEDRLKREEEEDAEV